MKLKPLFTIILTYGKIHNIMNLPIDFQNRMKQYLDQEYDDFLASFNEQNVKSFHVNTKRISIDQFDSLFLNNNELNLSKIPAISNGYYYKQDKIGKTPLSHAGIIYSQDPSAMLPVSDIPFEIKSNYKILDLCAAPGGKSSQLAMHLQENSGSILCNEINPTRNKILVSNIERMGYKNVLITRKTPDELASDYPGYFDIILVDAPCSGEGMFRKYPESVNEWSLENVKMCALRQKEILQSAISMLKNGGKLIYSTCTYSKEEDEEIVDYLINEGLNLLPVNNNKYIKCYPHKYEGEGQFYAYFQKGQENDVSNNESFTSSLKPVNSKTLEIIHEALKNNFDYSDIKFYLNDTNIIILPDNFIKLPKHGITHAGVTAGTIEKNRFVPHHQLFHCYGEKFKSGFDISHSDNSIEKYLHGEELICNDIPNGYGVILFEGIPIGGYKASNDRLKNHYPKGLRNM